MEPGGLFPTMHGRVTEIDGTEFVWEDLRPIPEEELKNHFPNIVEHCKKQGYDVTKECIPVVPAQHYYMGGVKVDHNSKTSMQQLYAVGETACNGVHGRNRLASNSLLESLVFAKRAADDIMENYDKLVKNTEIIKMTDMSEYKDKKAYSDANKRLVKEEIKKADEKQSR